MFTFAISVHADPSQDSTFGVRYVGALFIEPELHNAAVCDPEPYAPLLAVFKSVVSVQEVPFQDSFIAL